MSKKVISIGQFVNGSFGSYLKGGSPTDVVMYYAVEGDIEQGTVKWGFASPHREAVESYARGLEAAEKPMPSGQTEYMQKIIAGIGRAVVKAAQSGDQTTEKELRELAAKLAVWPSHKPLPERAVRYASM